MQTICRRSIRVAPLAILRLIGLRAGIRRDFAPWIAVLPLTAILLVASSALAPSPRAEDASKDITLSLAPNEVTYIWGVLAKQPYQDVAFLIQKMQAQVQAQAAKTAAAPPKNDHK